MLDIEIPKDIREYEPKVVGSFTTRQVFCLVGIALVLMLTTSIERNLLHFTQMTYIPAFPFCGIIGLIGWGNQLVGMPIERYLQLIFINAVLAPKHRPYVTHNYMVMEFDKIKAETQEKSDKKVTPVPKKLPPEYHAWP